MRVLLKMGKCLYYSLQGYYSIIHFVEWSTILNYIKLFYAMNLPSSYKLNTNQRFSKWIQANLQVRCDIGLKFVPYFTLLLLCVGVIRDLRNQFPEIVGITCMHINWFFLIRQLTRYIKVSISNNVMIVAQCQRSYDQ